MNERTLLTGANLIDGKGSVQADMSVAIEGEKIAAIGKRIDSSGSTRCIDLGGKTLMPGMTVGHWHGEFANIGPPEFSAGRGGTFLGTEKPPAILALQAANAMRVALHSGVLRVISGTCSNNLDVQMQMAVEQGLIKGPDVTPCSRHVVTTGDYEDRGQWWRTPAPPQDGLRRIGANVFADGVPAMIKAVREEILFGAEIIKIIPTGGHGFESKSRHRGLSNAEMRAVIDTAHERDKRVRAHVTTKAGILECIEAGIDIIDHGDGMDEECLDKMLERGIFFLPSLMFTKMLSHAGRGRAPDPAKVEDQAWANMLKMLPKANQAGLKIVPGDDYGGQGMAHELGVYARELEIYVNDVGIPALDVLRWSTAHGAQMALTDAVTGTIEVGKNADLLIVDGDPVKNIGVLTDPARSLKAIVQRGKFVKNELGTGRLVKQERTQVAASAS